MKKILISMLVLVPLLCGCTNVNTTLTLNKDKSATVTSVLNYDGNVLEKGNATAETIQNWHCAKRVPRKGVTAALECKKHLKTGIALNKCRAWGQLRH